MEVRWLVTQDVMKFERQIVRWSGLQAVIPPDSHRHTFKLLDSHSHAFVLPNSQVFILPDGHTFLLVDSHTVTLLYLQQTSQDAAIVCFFR